MKKEYISRPKNGQGKCMEARRTVWLNCRVWDGGIIYHEAEKIGWVLVVKISKD